MQSDHKDDESKRERSATLKRTYLMYPLEMKWFEKKIIHFVLLPQKTDLFFFLAVSPL
jgi:hypothetical protein